MPYCRKFIRAGIKEKSFIRYECSFDCVSVKALTMIAENQNLIALIP